MAFEDIGLASGLCGLRLLLRRLGLVLRRLAGKLT